MRQLRILYNPTCISMYSTFWKMVNNGYVKPRTETFIENVHTFVGDSGCGDVVVIFTHLHTLHNFKSLGHIKYFKL